MTYTIGAVVSQAFTLDDFLFTYNVSGSVTTDDVGKAVSQDTGAASTVKLAADNDVIFGRLETYENRITLGITVGTVARKLKCKLPATAGHGITVGKRVIGAGAGLVKLDPAGSGAGLVSNPLVIEVGTDFVVVEAL
jgi:hypothetical protein